MQLFRTRHGVVKVPLLFLLGTAATSSTNEPTTETSVSTSEITPDATTTR